jgi:hypothetical protein
MENKKRISIDPKKVADQFHSQQFDDSANGVIASRMWAGWQNMIATLNVEMHTPNRKGYDHYLSGFIPKYVHVDSDVEDGSDVWKAELEKAVRSHLPLNETEFDEECFDEFEHQGIPETLRSYDYRSWCNTTYRSAFGYKPPKIPLYMWIKYHCAHIATLIPNTLLRDMHLIDGLDYYTFTRGFVEFGDDYLRGLRRPFPCHTQDSTLVVGGQQRFITAMSIADMFRFCKDVCGFTARERYMLACRLNCMALLEHNRSFFKSIMPMLKGLIHGKLGTAQIHPETVPFFREVRKEVLMVAAEQYGYDNRHIKLQPDNLNVMLPLLTTAVDRAIATFPDLHVSEQGVIVTTRSNA